MDEIRVLQLGEENWGEKYRLPEYVDFHYEENPAGDTFDIVFLDRGLCDEEIAPLSRQMRAYTLFATEQLKPDERTNRLYRSKKGQRIATEDIQRFLLEEIRYYYPKRYGEKFKPKNLAVSRNFGGKVRWNGNYSVELEGDFGEEFCQVAFWRNNVPMSQGRTNDLWLEYRKTQGVEISLEVTRFQRGSASAVLSRQEFNEEELQQVVSIEGGTTDGNAMISLRARGRGVLEIIALHNRDSRGSHGFFLPGGERYVTSEREEVFCYFDPGDLKPPLNIYFSGYKMQQGFEGYNMIRDMGCPFLLISEPRLEGGCFYMGSEEYEKMLLSVIRKYMGELGFSPDEVILSGISMGTSGALYYGCDIMPHALILGKPMVNLGNVAANERYLRPGGFPASLDVLMRLENDTDPAAVGRLNDRFWEKFDKADWGRTKLIVSYMIEDDYDPTAYNMMISHLRSEGAQIYGKGIHGRHDDDTKTVLDWFLGQYRKILREDFGRKTGG